MLHFAEDEFNERSWAASDASLVAALDGTGVALRGGLSSSGTMS